MRSTRVSSPARATGDGQVELKPGEEVTREQIAREAYFLWLKRGGNDVVNWLEAESQLKKSRSLAPVT